MDAKFDALEVHWMCPHCLKLNVDDYQLTAEPSCGHCDLDTIWELILSPEKQAELNLLIMELEHLKAG